MTSIEQHIIHSPHFANRRCCSSTAGLHGLQTRFISGICPVTAAIMAFLTLFYNFTGSHVSFGRLVPAGTRRRPIQNPGKQHLPQGAEQRVGGEASAGYAGGSESRQKAAELARLGQHFGMFLAHLDCLIPEVLIDSRFRPWQQLRRPLTAQAPAAVPAVFGQAFSKIGAERPGLAAIEGGQVQDPAQALDLTFFVLQGPGMEFSRELIQFSRSLLPALALPNPSDPKLYQLLLNQVIEGSH